MRPSVFRKIKVINGCAIQNIRMVLFVYGLFYLVTMRKGGDLFVLPSLTGNIHKFETHANNQKLHILPYEQYITFRNTFCSHNTQPVNIQLYKINQNQISKKSSNLIINCESCAILCSPVYSSTWP